MNLPTMTSDEKKARLARLLLDKSYTRGTVTLTSGKTSDFYVDCKQTALHPEGSWLLGSLFTEMLVAESEAGPRFAGVGGMTLGADPLVSAVTVVSHLEGAFDGAGVPGFIIRKKSKGHGTNQYLEGLANFATGDTIALLEDVVTTGGTLLTAAERVRDAGLTVGAIFCILDREEGGRENLEQAGFALRSILTRSQMLGYDTTG